MNTTRTMITTIEAARRLDIDPKDLYRMIDGGEIPAFKGDRGRIVIPEDVLLSIEKG